MTRHRSARSIVLDVAEAATMTLVTWWAATHMLQAIVDAVR